VVPRAALVGVSVGQWLPVSSPLSISWMWALGLFRPMISTVLPRWAYLVSMASRAATEEASHVGGAQVDDDLVGGGGVVELADEVVGGGEEQFAGHGVDDTSAMVATT
jgi:hypothetical protein